MKEKNNGLSNNEVENYSVRGLEEKRGKYLREGGKK